jgi:hypothetical protein
MNVAEAAAAVLAREGVGVLLAYPLNPLSSRLGQASGCVLHAGWAGHVELFRRRQRFSVDQHPGQADNDAHNRSNHHSAQCPATS